MFSVVQVVTRFLGRGIVLAEVESNHLGAARVDGHVTLFYGDNKLVDHIVTVTESMQDVVSGLAPKVHFRSLTAWDYAEAWYAWNDIIVHCQLHQVLHRIVRAGVGDGRRFGVWRRMVFSISDV